jgi:hypothetical protein
MATGTVRLNMAQLQQRESESSAAETGRVHAVARAAHEENTHDPHIVASERGMSFRTWQRGVVCGTLGASVMAGLASLQNPGLTLGGRDAFVFYALLGAITGFCAVTGWRRTARTAAGMSAAVLLSPPLLVWLVAFLGENMAYNPAASPLVISACLPVGAFAWLYRTSPARAALKAGAALFVIDALYLTFSQGVPIGHPQALQAMVISGLHGLLLGGAVSSLRRSGEAWASWLKGGSPSSPAADPSRTA